MINPLILEKFGKLPEQAQDAVSEFIDYLYDKYEADVMETDSELTPEGELLLRERMEKARQHPAQHKSWAEIKQATYQKYDWKE